MRQIPLPRDHPLGFDAGHGGVVLVHAMHGGDAIGGRAGPSARAAPLQYVGRVQQPRPVDGATTIRGRAPRMTKPSASVHRRRQPHVGSTRRSRSARWGAKRRNETGRSIGPRRQSVPIGPRPAGSRKREERPTARRSEIRDDQATWRAPWCCGVRETKVYIANGRVCTTDLTHRDIPSPCHLVTLSPWGDENSVLPRAWHDLGCVARMAPHRPRVGGGLTEG